MRYLCAQLEDFEFEEHQQLRHVQLDDHQLQTWDAYETDRRGKTRIAYRLTKHGDDEVLCVFEARDFFCSAFVAVDSDESLRSLLTFLTLQEGDTDASYFEEYTEEQLEWRDSEAESLSMWALDDGPPFTHLDNFDGDADDDD